MTLPSFLQGLLAADPAARTMQTVVLSGGFLLLFFLFWTLKDVLLRSRSLPFQMFALLLVTGLPGFGFLLYLLVRPARTLAERETDRMLQILLREHGAKKSHHPQKKAKD